MSIPGLFLARIQEWAGTLSRSGSSPIRKITSLFSSLSNNAEALKKNSKIKHCKSNRDYITTELCHLVLGSIAESKALKFQFPIAQTDFCYGAERPTVQPIKKSQGKFFWSGGRTVGQGQSQGKFFLLDGWTVRLSDGGRRMDGSFYLALEPPNNLSIMYIKH